MSIPHIAILGKKGNPGCISRLRALSSYLKDVRLCVFRPYLDLLRSVGAGDVLPAADTFTSYQDLPDDITLFLSLGGDGTFLNALTLVRDRQIPVAGINLGRLGFLTSGVVEGNGDNSWMKSLTSGQYDVMERPLLQFCTDQTPEGFYPYALNEVSVQRCDAHLLGVDLKVDGRKLPTYWADGLVISTSTGSTAYSLSIGGPIVMPGSDVFTIAPISPHNLNVRPLVIPDKFELEMRLEAKFGSATFTADNRHFPISDKGTIIVRKAPFVMKSVMLSEDNFFDALHEKLLWGEDRRNKL